MKSKTVCIPRPTHTQATTVSSNGSVCWSDSGKMFPNRARAPKVRVPFFFFSSLLNLILCFLHLPPLSLHLEFQREKKKRINQSAISPIPSHCCSSIQFDSVQFNPIHPRPQGFEEKETEEKTPQPQLTSHVKNTIPNFTKKKKYK